MGCITPVRLPTIHFSDENLKSGASFRDDVWQAIEEFGCFEAMYDSVSLELHNAIFGLLEEDLFSLPLEIKCQNTSSKPFGGYIGNFSQYHLYEGFGIVDAASFEATQNFTNLMWPQGKSNSSEIFHSYAVKVSELEQMVKRMVMESLGVEKYYESHAESISYDFRLIKYKAPMTDERQVGAHSHTDKSFFTVLHQNQVSGLEVETKDGEWIRLTPSPSSFIVMVGDAFYAWSNGRVHCPRHRVMISGNEARYSIGLFSFSSDAVQCPEELIDEEHPLLFKPFYQLDILAFISTEEGRKAESTLKAYFGL